MVSSVFVFGFGVGVRDFCSGRCSGVGVEKMRKSLRESVWGNCEKVSTLLQDCSGCVIKLLKSGSNCGKSGKVYTWFCTGDNSLLSGWFYTVSTEPITIITNNLIERRQ